MRGIIVTYPKWGIYKRSLPASHQNNRAESFTMTVLEQLWQGTLHPAETIKPTNPEYSQLQSTADETEQKLLSLLTDEGKELFYKLKDISAQLCTIDEYDIFTNAFRLGAKLMQEIMDGTTAPPTID